MPVPPVPPRPMPWAPRPRLPPIQPPCRMGTYPCTTPRWLPLVAPTTTTPVFVHLRAWPPAQGLHRSPPALWNFNSGDSWVPHPDPSPHHQRSCHGTRDAPPDSRRLTNSRLYVYRRTVDPRHTTWSTCGRKLRSLIKTAYLSAYPDTRPTLVRARLPARAQPCCPAVTFPWGPESIVPAAPCPPVSTLQRGPRPPVPLRRVSRPVPALPAPPPVATPPSPAREAPSAQLHDQHPPPSSGLPHWVALKGPVPPARSPPSSDRRSTNRTRYLAGPDSTRGPVPMFQVSEPPN